MGENDLRLELADQVGEPVDRGGVHHERVVAEVEGAEVGAERGGRRLCLAVTDLLHALLGLPGLLPELARLAALAVRERDYVAVPPASTNVAIAPAARQTKSAECALTTRRV